MLVKSHHVPEDPKKMLRDPFLKPLKST
uniref:Uncharacterized protein n=1 Tax=Lepeophtheirus salmonis TaxID=72036 RepID=A0A0K2UUI5_LEPSM